MVSSRHRAKYAIQHDWVRVAGKVVSQPAFEVRGSEAIEVAEAADRPLGYWKMKQIDDAIGLFGSVDSALDLGSSGGGFLLYAAERCKTVVGIEMSRQFESALGRVREAHPHVRVVWGDAFRARVEGTFDLLLNDTTLDIGSSLQATARFVDRVGPGGKVLQAVKWSKPKRREPSVAIARAWLVGQGFQVRPPLDLGERESYLVGIRAVAKASSSGVNGPR